MYAGRIVEHGDAVGVFYRQNHPYTRGLLACLPRLDQRIDLDPRSAVRHRRSIGCRAVARSTPAVRSPSTAAVTEMPELRAFPSTAAACHVAPLEPADLFEPAEARS